MAGGEPRLGTTATYMRRVNQRSAILCQPQIAMLHDRNHGKNQAFSAASLKTWSKFGLERRCPISQMLKPLKAYRQSTSIWHLQLQQRRVLLPAINVAVFLGAGALGA